MADDGRDDGNATGARPARRSKVGRVIEDRELTGLGAELEAYWTGSGDEQYSLRELADLFNRRVLREAVQDANVNVLQGEIENFYELLTGDDVTGGSRVQTERRLEQEGVDIDQLKQDFVSHQAVHTYLTKYRGVDSDEDDTDQIEKTRSTLDQLRNKVRAVGETSIQTLKNTGRLSIGEFDIFVDVQVTCYDCQTQYSITELLDRERCECD
ncbi:rod-determining factor RdfA [Haloarchaeobius sp. TZWSO28]|uniref:rod-determining factor RdfA n=1 Tax=Haloarchaeobius sp. TZWSO28 TaxID=3446119 RepID=UPI003EBA33F8